MISLIYIRIILNKDKNCCESKVEMRRNGDEIKRDLANRLDSEIEAIKKQKRYFR